MPGPGMRQLLSAILGVSEIDIRDVYWFMNQDALLVRTWNHRKFVVDGLQLFSHPLSRSGVTMAGQPKRKGQHGKR